MGFAPAFGDGSLHVVVASVVEVFHQVHQACVRVWAVRQLILLLSYRSLLGFEDDIAPEFGCLSLLKSDRNAVRLDLHLALGNVDVLVQGLNPKAPVFVVEIADLKINRVEVKVDLHVVLVVRSDLFKARCQVDLYKSVLLVPRILWDRVEIKIRERDFLFFFVSLCYRLNF